tara:strand:+ start:3563 stop:5881 length:2319 start_codon:yes stop_codon:yes gene_type:complete
MSERIVSPGVFTREKDLSFLPQGIAEIGAAIIGPTSKGPAFVPTQVTSFAQFENIFGGLTTDYYVPYTVQEYIKNAPTVTIVRVMGLGGYQHESVSLVMDGEVAAVIKPSAGAQAQDFSAASVTAATKASLVISLTDGGGATGYSASLDPTSDSYITKVFGTDPKSSNAKGYVYKNFRSFQGSQASNSVVTVAFNNSIGENFKFDYNNAATPYIISQKVGGTAKNLFKIKTRSHGEDVNTKFKIAVSDLAAAGTVPGSDYSSFSLKVLRNNPGQTNDGEVLEQWANLNFDEDSVNYLPRAIGDRYVTIDSEGKLTYNGDWPNKSVHIYVSDYSTNLQGVDEAIVPHGFSAVSHPVTGSAIPTASFVTAQTNTLGVFDQNVYYGWNFSATAYDNQQYLAPIPSNVSAGANVAFSLENMLGDAGASAIGADTFSDAAEAITLTLSAKQQRKFVVPFQGGFDGVDPTVLKKTGGDIAANNTQGLDCSGANNSGSIGYKRAINAVSNPDEFDINLLVTPGIIHEYHSGVSKHAISKVEQRADAFYVMDGSRWGRSVTNAVADVNGIDTNYAAVYYPWVKILDSVKNKPMWVPPSVVLPGVISFTDSVAHEWFAPAGLNRGGLGSVLEAKTRLTHTERDDLYEGRVNPIASFPGQGVVVFGQKTLQGKPSALDRINVRRLLIRLRKFIASSSRFLVFEQNTAATRNRFLGIVNPFLESVQANSGLSAFKVVMDDSNNTPDVVDRNQLVGQIFIQPTRTAEFIVLDFVILPTGAAFPE